VFLLNGFLTANLHTDVSQHIHESCRCSTPSSMALMKLTTTQSDGD